MTASRPASRRPEQEQAALVSAAPETFGIPAYVGRHGWVSIQLATVDSAEFRELIVEAWRQTAPKRLVTAYDTARDSDGEGADRAVTEVAHRSRGGRAH